MNQSNFRVMKINEFSDTVYYRVACDCASEECDLTLDMSWDKEVGYIYLEIYKNLIASSYYGRLWKHFDFIRVWRNKIKMIKKIIFDGYIEIQGDTLFKDVEHIENFINALEQGKQFIIGRETKWQESQKSQKQTPENSENVKLDK